jgi:type VII secretion protein EssB
MKESIGMPEQKQPYLEHQLEAIIEKENNSRTFIFQRGKIKLNDSVELEMLKEIDPSIKKEIALTDDELNLKVEFPPAYLSFARLNNKDDQSRWMFAYQLVKKVQKHSLSRLHCIVCPENIVFDQSYTPYFLHYGVKESLPPYEKDEAVLFQELKATVAAAVDGKYTFEQYLKFYETLELSQFTANILAAAGIEELMDLILKNLHEIDEKEKKLVNIPIRRWKMTRYVAMGLLILLLPALIFTFYSLFFVQPKHAAFIDSQEHFLESEYSEVVNKLSGYKIEDMPNVVQYELARSYITNESLTEAQKEKVQKTITLQSDPQYFQYWILIGRGHAQNALEIARSLEDRDLILFGLLKYREEVKADEDLKSEEKQQKIKEIETEIEDYMKEQKAQQEEKDRQKEEEKKAEKLIKDQQDTEKSKETQTESGAQVQPGADQPVEPAASN